ncbi:zinc finger (ccch type) domain-containing protein [Cyclospora cayetanensis]|uniref:Zinc finger (Ccch type) domain-containing protein n=1 Tax=Cyclospora cayetanensis TaxID=88456 RepID=A0A1D3D3A9_9EIME|nr:zinc finger (ccch type) domain-containing protein [Cyclospora cayetanensis]
MSSQSSASAELQHQQQPQVSSGFLAQRQDGLLQQDSNRASVSSVRLSGHDAPRQISATTPSDASSQPRHSGSQDGLADGLVDAAVDCSLPLLNMHGLQRPSVQRTYEPSATSRPLLSARSDDPPPKGVKKASSYSRHIAVAMAAKGAAGQAIPVEPAYSEESQVAVGGLMQNLLAESSAAPDKDECGCCRDSCGSKDGGGSRSSCVWESVAKALLQQRMEEYHQLPVDAVSEVPQQQQPPGTATSSQARDTATHNALLALIHRFESNQDICLKSEFERKARESTMASPLTRPAVGSSPSGVVWPSAVAAATGVDTPLYGLNDTSDAAAVSALLSLQTPSNIRLLLNEGSSSGTRSGSSLQTLPLAAAAPAGAAAEDIEKLNFRRATTTAPPGCSQVSMVLPQERLFSALKLHEQGQVHCDEMQVQREQAGLPLTWLRDAVQNDLGELIGPLDNAGGSAYCLGTSGLGRQRGPAVGLPSRSFATGTAGEAPKAVSSSQSCKEKESLQQQQQRLPPHQSERGASLHEAEADARLTAFLSSMFGEESRGTMPPGLQQQQQEMSVKMRAGNSFGVIDNGEEVFLHHALSTPEAASQLATTGNPKLSGKCDFSRSCVFWHPPPEAEPSLLVCKYGRVCNAQHGHRVSYKELAAVVHAFVRRCPQLAPGESGRLYHYLRVSRSQPQQQIKQLGGRPVPTLPPYIVHHFYRILDSVQGRDLSAVNSVWRRLFGEPFPYAMFGFEQLRTAIASIPGIQLTTRGTNVIISRRSRKPATPSGDTHVSLLALPDRLRPLIEQRPQVSQQTSPHSQSATSLALITNTAEALVAQQAHQLVADTSRTPVLMERIMKLSQTAPGSL